MNRALTQLAVLAITLALAGVGVGGAAAQTTGEPKSGSPSPAELWEQERLNAKKKNQKKTPNKPKKRNTPKPKLPGPGPKAKKPPAKPRPMVPPRKGRLVPKGPPTGWWYEAFMYGNATQVTTYHNGSKKTATAKFQLGHGSDVRISKRTPLPGGPPAFQWTDLGGGVTVTESMVVTDAPATSRPTVSCTATRVVESATGPFLAGIRIYGGVNTGSPSGVRFDSGRGDRPGTYSSSGQTCTHSNGVQTATLPVLRPTRRAPLPPSCLIGNGGTHESSVDGTARLTEAFLLTVTCRHYKETSAESVDTRVTVAIQFTPCPEPTGRTRRC
jgi:hypothetical protein